MLYCDVKFSNVFLDVDCNVYLGNFSYVLLVDYNKLVEFMVLDGIFGYMVFEIFFIGKFIVKFDVFSFGILMLVVVCGCFLLDW